MGEAHWRGGDELIHIFETNSYGSPLLIFSQLRAYHDDYLLVQLMKMNII